jgi:ankyrin repeat protein
VAANAGATPLFAAAQRGHTDVVRLLLAARASVDTPTSGTDATPLYVAAANGHDDVIRLLIGAGASVDHAHINGSTPLVVAVRNGHAGIVRQLLLANASLWTRWQECSGLLSAVLSTSLASLTLLRAAGADHSALEHGTAAIWNGWSCMTWAASKNHYECAVLLVAAGATVTDVDLRQVPIETRHLWISMPDAHVVAARKTLATACFGAVRRRLSEICVCLGPAISRAFCASRLVGSVYVSFA